MAVVRDVLDRVVRSDEPPPDFLKATVPDGVSERFALQFAKPKIREPPRNAEVGDHVAGLDRLVRVGVDERQRALDESA